MTFSFWGFKATEKKVRAAGLLSDIILTAVIYNKIDTVRSGWFGSQFCDRDKIEQGDINSLSNLSYS